MNIKKLTKLTIEVKESPFYSSPTSMYRMKDIGIKLIVDKQNYNVDHIYKLDETTMKYGVIKLDDRTPYDKAIDEQAKSMYATKITFINGDTITVKETIEELMCAPEFGEN